MNIPENILNTLTDEQKKKVEAAKSPEELLALVKETGYELTDEQLQSLSGGHIGGCVPVTACSNVCTADEWW